ncbi:MULTISPECIES: TetR/AcrR family transcriptional regulator [unclassified Streptomyces]|uniref:TetR/AcrR family transcriptional regulator n=1 Tax=unclassified Streptomyces TaxID=2593676 RepID=UPI0036FA13F1
MVMEREQEEGGPTPRQKIVLAAAELLESEGLEALSTRAVAARAGVPAPTIFRLFGDKYGLLEELAQHGFERYLGRKARFFTAGDPVQNLRDAWDLHVDFGLRHPEYYSLVYCQVRPGYMPQAGHAAAAGLRHMMTKVAAAGRLRMGVTRSAEVMHSAGMGTVLTLTALPEDERDLRTSHVARDMVIDALTLPAEKQNGGAASNGLPSTGLAHRAVALLATLEQGDDAAVLSPGERTLLCEWLNRLADSGQSA